MNCYHLVKRTTSTCVITCIGDRIGGTCGSTTQVQLTSYCIYRRTVIYAKAASCYTCDGRSGVRISETYLRRIDKACFIFREAAGDT